MTRLLQRLTILRRNLFAQHEMDRDLDDELRAYLDLSVEAKRGAGLSGTEARRAALIEFGGVEQVKEEVRDQRTGRMFTELLRDLRYGLRSLRRNPHFSIASVAILALGIGATTAIFSVAYGILERPLPYADSDRIAVVYLRYAPRDFAFGTMCMRDYLIWKEQNRSFEDPTLFSTRRVDIGGREGVPQQAQGASVTAGFFATLGVNPLIGRTFGPGDDKPPVASLAVLSESLWRTRFAAQEAILGQTVTVNGIPTTVIGVMPERFGFPHRDTEIWTNLPLNPPTRFGPWFYRGVARLKPGVTHEQAQADLNTIGQTLMRENSHYRNLTMPLLPIREAIVGTGLRPAIVMLAAAVALVLLIALVNVANLMLVRATVREREIALRLSLGAGRARLVRQLLAESALLAAIGGAGGLVVAWGAIQFIRGWNPGNLPLIDSVRLDGAVLAFTFAVSMGAGVVFGLVPALQSVRADLNATIREGGRTGSGGGTSGRLRSALVVGEIAFSLMLLVGAGLLLRSFANLLLVDGGFTVSPKRILTMLISPDARKYGDAKEGIAFYDEVLERARSIKGVEAAALTDSLPPDRQGDADTFGIEGQDLPPGETNAIVSDPTVGPDFFRVLGIPLIKGRTFDTYDREGSRPVAVVSEGLARRYFPNGDALGKRIRQSGAENGMGWREIVGVVGNVKYLGVTVETDAAYYMPFAQSYLPRMYLVVRSPGDAALLAGALRAEVQSIDAGATLAQIGTMERDMATSVSQPRFDAMSLGLFAAIALGLAAVGIYGLTAYTVAQRTHEFALRMALGADAADVVRGVLRQSVRLAGAGIAIGLGGSFALGGLLRGLLFGVAPTDWLAFAAAPAGILVVVLLAAYLPAFRASRIAPAVALRYE